MTVRKLREQGMRETRMLEEEKGNRVERREGGRERANQYNNPRGNSRAGLLMNHHLWPRKGGGGPTGKVIGNMKGIPENE